jgi:homocitrate synthase NifV
VSETARSVFLTALKKAGRRQGNRAEGKGAPCRIAYRRSKRYNRRQERGVEQVRIIDTTLRDGGQAPGIVFSQSEKLEIAAFLDESGVYQIEAGSPAVGESERAAIRSIAERVKRAKVAVWNRLSTKDIAYSFECEPDVIHLCAPVSEAHIRTKLRQTEAWVQKTLAECVDFAKNRGYAVSVGYEDASRADMPFLYALTRMLEPLDVAFVRYGDTVGVLTPSRTKQAIGELCALTRIPVGIHTHNDLGMAVANAVAAVKVGARYVDATLSGIGERAGNCDLGAFVRAVAGTPFAGVLAANVQPVPVSLRLLDVKAFGGKFRFDPRRDMAAYDGQAGKIGV